MGERLGEPAFPPRTRRSRARVPYMISTKQYTDTYNRWTESLRKSSEMLTASSECRKVLIKNVDSADPLDLLQEAVNCIYDLTGDRCFLKEVTEGIERRRKDNK